MFRTIHDFRIGPKEVPKIIRQLITLTCSFAIGATLISLIYRQLTGYIGPEYWFSLSWNGLMNGYIWQPITYLFTYYSYPYGFTFSYFLSLFFQMYLLWWVGSSLVTLIGEWSFLKFYLASGAIAGVVATLVSASTIYSGPIAPIVALLVLYVMFHPDAQFFILFLFPVYARLLVFGGLALYFLMALSSGNWTVATLMLTGALVSYLYSVIVWKRTSPFSQTHTFDRFLMNIGFSKSKGKIVDFPGKKKKLKDDAFIDQMLKKISREGEESLTWRERRRMKKISERRRKGY